MASKKQEVERTIQLLPKQWEFLNAPEKYVAYIGGLGVGKTFVGSAFIVKQVIEEGPDVVGFIGAQSHRQLNNAVFPALRRAFDIAGIKYEWNEAKNTIMANGRRIVYNTLDSDSIEAILGTEFGWFWIDEADYTPEYSVKLVKSRLRCPIAKNLFGRFTSSPNGFRVMYEMFAANPDEHHRLIRATSYDNPHLPPSYIADLKKQYTPLEFRQQVLGEFVNLSGGQIYDCFNEEKHVMEFNHRDLHSKIYIGLDFNVGQMCAVCIKYENGRFYVFDEIYLKDSNTIGMAQEIAKRFPSYQRDVFIVPDSTFDTRSVTSEKTSKEILRRMRFQILPTRNPYIGERQLALNATFWNEGRDDLKIIIHPRCARLRKELNTLTADDKEGDVSHLAVALGYVVWKLDPLRRPRRTSRVL
jgi:phage terminase large subunit